MTLCLMSLVLLKSSIKVSIQRSVHRYRFNKLQFLTFLQARVRELRRNDARSNAITLMLAGIPNVGKSALANSLHQVGRISAAGAYLCAIELKLSSLLRDLSIFKAPTIIIQSV